jgi:hypothetical protein
MCSRIVSIVGAILCVALLASAVTAKPLGHEAQAVLDIILASPVIKPEAGFSAQMLIPPGELYDPLFMRPHGNQVWMNDDGRATDGHGSRLLAITPQGGISVLMGADKLLLVTSFDLAPEGFGSNAGQLFSLSQATTAMKGALSNHVIQRIDLAERHATVFCTLPNAGTVGKGVPGFGIDARFGPNSSAFANVFYSVTALNHMIYQTLPDGTCKPFADLSQFGSPGALSFAADGSAMLVTVTPGETSASGKPSGLIVRITPDGKIDPKPVAKGLTLPLGLDIAPAGFGAYGGQIFVADAGDFQAPVPQTQALNRDGKVYMVTKEGELKLVASGFVNPAGVRFIGNQLWVSDINGDFVAGMRELPDGFLVQIDAR